MGRACVAHLSFYFEETLDRTFHRCFLPKFGSYGYSISEKIFLGINQSETIIAYGGHVCYYIAICNRGHSIDASYQVSVYLAKWFQRRRLQCEKLTDDKRQVEAKAHIAFGTVN
jgi:hypothetical protein